METNLFLLEALSSTRHMFLLMILSFQKLVIPIK